MKRINADFHSGWWVVTRDFPLIVNEGLKIYRDALDKMRYDSGGKGYGIMFVFDLKVTIFCLLIVVGGVVYGAITAVSRRLTSPLDLLDLDTRQSLHAAPFGFLLVDSRPYIIYSNQYAQHLLAQANWQNDLLADIRTLVTPTASRYRVVNLPKEQAVSWWICPVGQWALVLLLDLGQQRQMERASHLFLNSLSHELRTPLTAVLTHLAVLQTNNLPDNVRQNSLSLIQQETQRISRLVQSLLDLSRLQTTAELELRPIDLLLLAEEAIADIILTAEARQIFVSLQADSGLMRVLANRDKLKQVLLNILDNAVKYGRSGDKITVSLQKRPSAIQVVVQDSGPGIPAHHLPHITESLYRARPDVEGSGLGLAIVAAILRHHHSQLEIESEEGVGTAVKFTLPTT